MNWNIGRAARKHQAAPCCEGRRLEGEGAGTCQDLSLWEGLQREQGLGAQGSCGDGSRRGGPSRHGGP